MQGNWIKFYSKLLDSPVFDNPAVLKVWVWALLKATYQERQAVVGYQTISLAPGEFIFGSHTAANKLKMSKSTVWRCMSMLVQLGNLEIKSTNKFSIVKIKNWTVYQERGKQTGNKRETNGKQVGTNKNIKNIKNNTVANATVLIGEETFMTSELTYETTEPKGKSQFGRKTMAYLAYQYLEAKGIKLEQGETYDANKIAKGLSKIYNECKKDAVKTANRIKIAGEYFSSKGLDWTPEAVWRRWEDIKKWYENGKPKDTKVEPKKNNALYE